MTPLTPSLTCVLLTLAITTSWLSGSALFNITVLYIAIPAMIFFLTTSVVAVIVCRKSPVLSIGIILSLLASLLCVVLTPTLMVYVLSPWTMSHADATIVRLGGISDTAVNLWVRSPTSDTFTVKYRDTTSSSSDWTTTVPTPLPSSTDHTSIVTLSNLLPSSTYEYTVENVPNSPSSTFTTLPPKHAPGQIKFAFSSCAMKSMHAGYELIGFDKLRKLSPSFAIFLGDLIYADVPLSFLGLGTNVDAYRSHYRRTFDDPYMAFTGLSLPIQYMYDDHEILNDEYAGSSNLGTPLPDADLTRNNTDGFVPVHFAIDAGPACVFVMDTRGFRREKSETEEKLVLGEGQMEQVKSWLVRSHSFCPFKILASPVPVTPNYSHEEGWGGSNDLGKILQFADNSSIDGIVFISGDSHMQGVYELAPGVIEVSASPASAQGVPFQTIGMEEKFDKGQVVWEQTEMGSQCGEQWGTVDVDTSVAGEERMAIELYSSCGSGNNYAAPLLEITITAGKDWQITGGSQRDLAVAQSAAEVAAGGVPLRTQKLGGGASFVPMMDGTAWVIVALFTLVPVSIVLAVDVHPTKRVLNHAAARSRFSCWLGNVAIRYLSVRNRLADLALVLAFETASF
ncbi:hypothetical protein TrRE_jg7397 [Triparma retinervis]|uniref:Fibronectin type-III domain-containing protein n=1 Tax=Triparma retinervis TaxID=2557542 RepID=A0A9W7EE80_9STRA|nr:hypothetical protein TrRE_jg7397 [Triparma retinervis]